MSLKFPKSSDKNFVRNLSKQYKLVPYLDKYLMSEVEGFEFTHSPKISDTAWHPSGDCTPAPSELYDKATGALVKEPFGLGLMKTFMVGHFWHALLQKAVVDLELAEPSAIERQGINVWEYIDSDDDEIIVDATSGIVATQKQKIPKPYHWATGAGDVAPCVIPKFGEYIVDFKTMSSYQYKSNDIPAWAADKYEAQINIYMDFFDQEQALIVAINKDTPHDFKEFEFERNQPLIDAIYEKFRFVSHCIDEGIRPTEDLDAEFDIVGLCQGPRK